MARIFRQAILGVSVPVGVIAVLGFFNRPGRVSRAFCIGLGATALATAAMWGYSWRFETRHPDESREFWRLQESKMRPRMFVAFALGLLAGASMIAVALDRGDEVIAAAAIAPTLLCFSVVLLMWGKVP